MSLTPASRESSPLPLPPQGDAPLVPEAGSKAAACAPCEEPIIERMPLSSIEPPITPAAAAAALPRNEPPDGIGAPAAMPGMGCGACIGCGCVPVCQAGDIAAASAGRTEGTEPRPSRLPKRLSRIPPRKLVSRGSASLGAALSSSRMRASARLSASSCTSTVCTSAYGALGAWRKPSRISRSASGSRGASSSVARRSNNSITRLRSSGVMVVSLLPGDGIHVSNARCNGNDRWTRKSSKLVFLVPPVGCLVQRSRQRYAVVREHHRKSVAGEKSIFLFPERRQRIEPLKFRIDKAGMAHDHAAVGQGIEEAREQRGEVRARIERIGAGEGRIRAQSSRRGPPPKSVAEQIEQQPLGVGKALCERRRSPALAQPCIRRGAWNDLEHGVADLRQHMHVVMTVDEIGCAAGRVQKPF